MTSPGTPPARPAPPHKLWGGRFAAGPAAVMRLRAMGARCTKLEPLAADGGSADPMSHYRPAAYQTMHQGVRVVGADLKQPAGQKKLHALLAQTDVLITSFRPSALKKLGIAPQALKQTYPSLIQVSIVGSPGPKAEHPGHDLTYMAECGLVPDLALPASLFADMGGSLLVTEAVLKALLQRQQRSGAAVFNDRFIHDFLKNQSRLSPRYGDRSGTCGRYHRWGTIIRHLCAYSGRR